MAANQGPPGGPDRRILLEMKSNTDLPAKSLHPMLDGPIMGTMASFFVPVALGSVIQQLYSMADAVILGRFIGKSALAAVGGSASAVIHLVTLFVIGFTSGGSVIISQAFGRQDAEGTRVGIETALTFSGLLGIFLTIAGILLSPLFVALLRTPPEIVGIAVSYLRIYMVGMVPILVYNMGYKSLLALGDSRKPLLYLVVSAVANIALDLLFVAVLDGGAAGAAIASVLAQALSALLTVRELARRQKRLRPRIDRASLRGLLRTGLPTGFQHTTYTLTGLFFQRAVNILGTDSAAAWSAFFRLDGFFWSVSGGAGETVLTFAGQNYGASNIERIRRGVRCFLLFDLGISVFFGSVMCVFRHPLVALFNGDPNVVAIGSQVILANSPFYFFFAFTEVYCAAIRGTGSTLKQAIITFFTVCVLRLILLYTFALPRADNVGIALCYPATWFVSSVIFVIYYHTYKPLRVPKA